MSWQDQLKGDSISWVLETDAPAVRYLALRNLLACPNDDPQMCTVRTSAHQNGPIAQILDQMDPEGFWVEPGPGYLPKYRSTVWSIVLLAQLGASIQVDERIDIACKYLLDHALTKMGQFTLSGAPSGTVDCLQGNLLWALVELGCEDPRLEIAFDWMARSVTGEGIASQDDKLAPVRYYAGKCGPNFACGANNKLACAWGAVKVMRAFGVLPAHLRTAVTQRAVQQGVDFLFSVDMVTAAYPTGYADKPSQNWWKFGFPVFYITDLLQAAEALVVLGYGDDPRLRSVIELIREKQDGSGKWTLEYDYAGKTWVEFGPKKQPSKWVTLRALQVLKAAAG